MTHGAGLRPRRLFDGILLYQILATASSAQLVPGVSNLQMQVLWNGYPPGDRK
jgi:hypothetical protein